VDVFVLSNHPTFNPIIIIPVYNHQHAISQTVSEALQQGYPILLVDDGSDEACKQVLIRLALHNPEQVTLLRLKHNGGKGAAVKAGFMHSEHRGFTHAIQVDADGQHTISDIARFISAGKAHPNTLISGYPSYDESVPKARYYSRYLTHIWVWINTLSFCIKDSMCGFRLYPLQQTVLLINQEPCGNRMDFDTEIIVRWVWRGGKVENLLTNVNYPTDGVSHFNVLHDNIRISWMHTRLFFGMLKRLPSLLKQKL
jgi:glycosyltransferase involved in cell wall biosynthesis